MTQPTAPILEAIPGGLGFVRGPVLASCVHGLFEAPGIVGALFGDDRSASLDETFDRLADAVDAGLDIEAIERALGAPLRSGAWAPR